ncbi:MAG: recombinase family protein [Alphaproteobacteria bacterium]|nr:recombinase family protein [Alphaproteobacteria bacterium]
MAVRKLTTPRSSLQRGPETPPRIFGYCRVSTSEQSENGVSLAEQERRIRGRALEQDWNLAKIFIEGGISGSVPLGQRPQGQQLLATVADQSRLPRGRSYRCRRRGLEPPSPLGQHRPNQPFLVCRKNSRSSPPIALALDSRARAVSNIACWLSLRRLASSHTASARARSSASSAMMAGASMSAIFHQRHRLSVGCG